jgi:hypothetical protein
VPGSVCTRDQLAVRLRSWFDELPEPATLVYDYSYDLELLTNALDSEGGAKPPANICDKLLLSAEIVSDATFQNALNRTFTRDWPPHHALADARAIMSGYRAWIAKNEEN